MEISIFLNLLFLATGASFYSCQHYGRRCPDHPYYVQLVQQLVDDPMEVLDDIELFPAFSLCSGTLVHPQWVLTTGDCYYEEYPNQTMLPLKVEFGTYDRRPAQRYQLAPIDNLRRFNNVSGTNSIMLVRLPEPVRDKAPVQLPASSCTRPGIGETVLVLNAHRRNWDSSWLSLYCEKRKVTACRAAACRQTEIFEDVFCAERPINPCTFMQCPTDNGGALVRREGTSDVLYGVKVSNFRFIDVCFGPIWNWINDTINEL